MLKNILFVSSLFFSFIYGKNIEHCNKIGSMQNNINNSPMYSMGLYVCLELPENNFESENLNISKNNKKEKGKFLSNFTKLNSENITDFKKNFTFDSPHSNITDIDIISPSPFAFTNNPSQNIIPRTEFVDTDFYDIQVLSTQTIGRPGYQIFYKFYWSI